MDLIITTQETKSLPANHSTADIEALLDHYERTQGETRWQSDIYRAAVDEINRRFEAAFHQMSVKP